MAFKEDDRIKLLKIKPELHYKKYFLFVNVVFVTYFSIKPCLLLIIIEKNCSPCHKNYFNVFDFTHFFCHHIDISFFSHIYVIKNVNEFIEEMNVKDISLCQTQLPMKFNYNGNFFYLIKNSFYGHKTTTFHLQVGVKRKWDIKSILVVRGI